MLKSKLQSFVALLIIASLSLPQIPTRAQETSHTFPETGKTVRGIFLRYWTTHGGLAQQGYPISDEMMLVSTDGKEYRTQFFQRAVFEHHPEFAGTHNEVLLKLAGQTFYERHFQNSPPPNQAVNPTNTITFKETGHAIGGKFREYWEKHGGLAQQGYPMTGEFKMVSTDGKEYTTQVFQRAVFELHPEFAGTENEVLLRLLGVEEWEALNSPTPMATLTTQASPTPTATVRNTGEKASEIARRLLYNPNYATPEDYSIAENVIIEDKVYDEVLVYKTGRIDGVYFGGEWKRGIPYQIGNQLVLIDGIITDELQRIGTDAAQILAEDPIRSAAKQLADTKGTSPEEEYQRIAANKYKARINLPVSAGRLDNAQQTTLISLQPTDVDFSQVSFTFLDSYHTREFDALLGNSSLKHVSDDFRFATIVDKGGRLNFVVRVEINFNDPDSRGIYRQSLYTFYLVTMLSNLKNDFVDDPSNPLFKQVADGGYNATFNYLDRRRYVVDLDNTIFKLETFQARSAS